MVCDTVPSEMAGWADVILPDTTFLERHDELLTGFGRTGWASLRQPVVAPPHDQKPAWWIAKQLAEKLGVGAVHAVQGHGGIPVATASRSRATAGTTLKKDGVIMARAQAHHGGGRAWS